MDDEEIVRYSLKNILTTNGFEVDEVGSAEEALKLLYTKSFHLVLTDLVLEGMGGLELLENIKVISPQDTGYRDHGLWFPEDRSGGAQARGV